MPAGLVIRNKEWLVYGERLTPFMRDRIRFLEQAGYLFKESRKGLATVYAATGTKDQYLEGGDLLLRHYGSEAITDR